MPKPRIVTKFISSDISWLLLFLYYSFGVQKTNAFIPSRCFLENDTRFKIMVKICTRFQTKTAQKPYPMGRNIPIQLIQGSTHRELISIPFYISLASCVPPTSENILKCYNYVITSNTAKEQKIPRRSHRDIEPKQYSQMMVRKQELVVKV